MFVDNGGGINHQSSEEGGEAFVDDETLKQVVFGKASAIILDSDG